MEAPTPLVEGARPPGWGSSSDLVNQGITDLFYAAFRCDRVSWGPYERGPVFTMVERHNDFEEPGECREGANPLRVILQSIWFSDLELVEFAKTQFGMPAFFGEFSFNVSTTEMVHKARWTWSPPGGNVSELVSFSRDDHLLNSADYVQRHFWHNGAGVSFMEMSENYKTPEPAPSAATGNLPAPMLWGQSMPNDSFFTPDRSDHMLEANLSASITRFGDLECKDPL